jgi:hypothetical protein
MATDPRTRRRWFILAALGAAHVVVLFVGPLVTDQAGLFPIQDWVVADLAGNVPPHWLLGAVATVGIWVALGSGRWFVRLGIGVLGWLWLIMALVLGELLTPNWPYAMSTWLLHAVFSAAASVLLLAVARRFGWHLPLDGMSAEPTTGRFQFRLAHLAAAVALISITLAVGRLLNDRFVHFTLSHLLWPRFVLDWLTRVAVEAWCPAVIAGATVLLTLGKRPRVLWLVPLFPVLIALDAAVQYGEFLHRNWLGFHYFSEVYIELLRERFVCDGALMFSLLLSALLLRRAGYRLSRSTRATCDQSPTPAR